MQTSCSGYVVDSSNVANRVEARSESHTGATLVRDCLMHCGAGPYRVSGVSFLFMDFASTIDESEPPRVTATPKRNTKLKGDISELRVATALTEAGYAVSK